MPGATSTLMKPQAFVPERFLQPTSGQVSLPGSPLRGAVWKDHTSLPVCASHPRMSPYARVLGAPSPLGEPVMTMSLKIAGGD
jgi:hypothetical protein